MKSKSKQQDQMAAPDVVDVLQHIADNAKKIAGAITLVDAVGGQDVHGGHVECLTEAVMGVSQSLAQIAKAIEDLADAVRDVRSG
jgi:hypothetical protein